MAYEIEEGIKTIFLNDRMFSVYFRFFFHLIIFFLLRFLIKSHIHARGFLHVCLNLLSLPFSFEMYPHVSSMAHSDCYCNKYHIKISVTMWSRCETSATDSAKRTEIPKSISNQKHDRELPNILPSLLMQTRPWSRYNS